MKHPSLPIAVLSLIVCVLGLVARAADATPAKPNIIFILADDWGLDRTGCYGADTFKTPHLDALAAGGLRFQTCYATPYCGPTRAELMTGRYPFRTGALGNGLAASVDPKREFGLPAMLRQTGYATALAGKWRQMTGDLREWGFDEWMTDPSPAGWSWEKSYLKNGQEVKLDAEVYCPDVFHEFAIDFIRRHRDGPFFLHYASHFTHAPIVRTPLSKLGVEADKLQIFFDNHSYLDRQVGELVAELDRLGIREQTLIIFTGDNGPTVGHHREAGLGGRKILGGKGTLLEGGTRVPLIANWKGKTPPGQVCSDLVDFSDFHATFAELAGVTRPNHMVFDGRSFAPQLLGRPGQPREHVFVQLQGEWFVRDAGWKLTGRGELFDMSDAPFGEKLVAADAQSPGATAARKRLQAALDRLNPARGVLGRGDDTSAMWRVLGGPEKEKGDAVQILHNANGNVSVSVQGRRGTVLRQFQATQIPAILTFRFQSTFDPKAREIPTELFGTGDFRIFVGTSGSALNGRESNEADLGTYEGFQFRIFPHLKDSPERIKTGDESHTATSLWVRYSDPKRCLDGIGLPHTGLMSDAAQNRNRQNGIHNCGWSRVSLYPGGFGLPNGGPAEVTIRITRELISIEAGGKRFSHPLQANERRISQIDTIAVSHTNISRGYQTYSISNLRLSEMTD